MKKLVILFSLCLLCASIAAQGVKNVVNNRHNYMLLFFQHFCGQASQHELTHEDLVGYFEGTIKCAFKKDINNSTLSLVACMNKADNVYDVKELLIKYITAFYKSKFNSYEEPYKIIATKYHDKKHCNRFGLS